MQLKKRDKNNKSASRSIRNKLALATCTLLQATGQPVQAADNEWQIDADILLYAESDNRVSLAEPVINLKKDMNEDDSLNVRIVIDTITGSTPNGALPANRVQTFTNPSGNSSYAIASGNIALNSTFRDQRTALSADYSQSIDRLSQINWGINLNKEIDFASLGGSVTYRQDLNKRNSTFTMGLGTSLDKWFPIGDINTEFAYMINARSNTPQPKGGSDSKTTTDIMLGWTQVINRSTLMQFNLGLSNSRGYLTDPYKIISIVDINGEPASAGLPAGALPYRYEKRPDTRNRKTIYWKTVHHLTEDVVNFSYRYFTDDWGINSHTFDLHYRYELGNNNYLQPRLRYYQQSAADFYQHSLVIDNALPDYASNDYRLGEFTSLTLGVKYSMSLGREREFSFRIETMTQNYNKVGTLLGTQNTLDIVPDLKAIIIQMGYSLYW